MLNLPFLLDDFISLFFPHLCFACDDALRKNEDVLCSICLNSLPKTDFHQKKDNPVAKLFWGRADIHAATAYYYFHKGDKVQHLVHQLKYKGARKIGIFVGKQMGYELKNAPDFSSVDMVVPVPLHPKKEKKRGYNQSEMFGLGISQGLRKPMKTNILYRKRFTETQTRKTRSERWENVENVFAIHHPESFSGKHLLLVDDVITTGSTLEACIHALESIPQVTISIAAMATAVSE
ncbi:MAG: ComF family protein [Bacteroidales bacterium]|nr:ComF family protein [Bacteroidales bacterium]